MHTAIQNGNFKKKLIPNWQASNLLEFDFLTDQTDVAKLLVELESDMEEVESLQSKYHAQSDFINHVCRIVLQIIYQFTFLCGFIFFTIVWVLAMHKLVLFFSNKENFKRSDVLFTLMSLIAYFLMHIVFDVLMFQYLISDFVQTRLK